MPVARSAKQGDELTVKYAHTLNDKTTAAAEYQLVRSKAQHLITLGLSNRCTKDCEAKAKINSNGVAAVSATFRMCPNARLRLSGQVDTANLGTANHKVGLALLAEL